MTLQQIGQVFLADLQRARSLDISVIRAIYCRLIRPRPPRHAGRARSSLSSSVGASRRVRDCRKSRRIVSSSGCNRGAKPSMVCRRYVHRFMRPWLRAAKAAWGSDFAYKARRSSSDIHNYTLLQVLVTLERGSSIASSG